MMDNKFTKQYSTRTRREAWSLEQDWQQRQIWYPTPEYVSWLERQLSKQMSNGTVIIELREGKIAGIIADRAMNAVVVNHSLKNLDFIYSDTLSEQPLRDFPITRVETKKVFAKNWGRVSRCPGFVKAALKLLGF